ncbi:MAG TPA: HYR domain-containing protein [Gaiellaceae bacterium]|nr:HYR domain-containing protein [Gaiellaceae bacterium]
MGKFIGVVVVLSAMAAGITATPSASSPSGSLSLRGTVPVLSLLTQCPPGTNPAPDDCRARSGTTLIRGLGRVSESYTWSYRMGPPSCPPGLGKPLAAAARLRVAGKGDIAIALADGARCIEQEPLRNEPQSFVITGGTGPYEGASGTGTAERAISSGSGTETWMGTLTVPGLEFDLTRPTIAGAANKVVRAKRGAKSTRVAFRVTARDDRDGALATRCTPRTGSKFELGRTRVACSATDSSANKATASFTVTVRKTR